jgi:hypothetical protein
MDIKKPGAEGGIPVFIPEMRIRQARGLILPQLSRNLFSFHSSVKKIQGNVSLSLSEGFPHCFSSSTSLFGI